MTWAYFVIDLISGGGNWSAVVALFVGLFYLAVGAGIDATELSGRTASGCTSRRRS